MLDRIGHTPLLCLDRITAHLPGVQILGKAAYLMVKRLAHESGLLVGVSAAAAVAAALQIAEELPSNTEAAIVTILPDGADKYLSERFWNE